MRLPNRRDPTEERRGRLRKEGAYPENGDGSHLHRVECFKCGALIAELERMGPGDYILLPPDVDPSEAETIPRPHPWTVIVWCERCRAKRRLVVHPAGPAPPEKS